MSTKNKKNAIDGDHVDQQCSVKTNQKLINNDIRDTFTEHLDGFDRSDYESPSLSGASEKMKIMLQKTYKRMADRDKPYPGDMEKIQSWEGLDYREEAGVKIISLPGFGEFFSTAKSKTTYKDIFSGYTRCRHLNIGQLQNSPAFKKFASTIKGCKVMGYLDYFKLMNMVAQQLGITDKIDEEYLRKQYDEYPYIDLPQDNAVGRIGRMLGMIIGDCCSMPISVENGMLRSIDFNEESCYLDFCFYGDYSLWPLGKIVK